MTAVDLKLIDYFDVIPIDYNLRELSCNLMKKEKNNDRGKDEQLYESMFRIIEF